MMIKQLFKALGGLLNGLAALALVGIFLWVAGLIDAATFAQLGVMHAALLRTLIGAVPWANIVTCLLLGIFAVSIYLAWDRVRRWALMLRPLHVKLVD